MGMNGYSSSSGSIGSAGGVEKPNEGTGVTGAGFMGSSTLAGCRVSEGLGRAAEGRTLGRLGGLVTAATAPDLALAFAATFFLTGAFREAVFLAPFFIPDGLRAAAFLFTPPLAG